MQLGILYAKNTLIFQNILHFYVFLMCTKSCHVTLLNTFWNFFMNIHPIQPFPLCLGLIRQHIKKVIVNIPLGCLSPKSFD